MSFLYWASYCSHRVFDAGNISEKINFLPKSRVGAGLPKKSCFPLFFLFATLYFLTWSKETWSQTIGYAHRFRPGLQIFMFFLFLPQAISDMLGPKKHDHQILGTHTDSVLGYKSSWPFYFYHKQSRKSRKSTSPGPNTRFHVILSCGHKILYYKVLLCTIK